MPYSIDQSTPVGTDSPSDAPTLFQDIKAFIVNIFGVSDATSYTLPAFTINATTSAVTFNQANTILVNVAIQQGTVTSNTPTLQMSTTWNSAGTTFQGLLYSVTDTASATASKLFQLAVTGSTKFQVLKGGDVSASSSLAVGLSAVAATGAIRLQNNAFVIGRNNTDAADITCIGVDSSNRVVISSGGDPIKWGVAKIAVGGGSAATLSAAGIGGAGQPTVGGQSGWIKFVDTAGATNWIPVWI